MKSYVFYDDTDCGGIVYHANYIKFCERARSLIFFENNCLPQSESEGFVVTNIESKFISPLKFGDFYCVSTKVIECKNTSITLLQEIYKIGSVGKARNEAIKSSKECSLNKIGEIKERELKNKINKTQDFLESNAIESSFLDSKTLDSKNSNILTFKAIIKLAYLDFKSKKIKKIPSHLMKIIDEFYV